VHTDAAVSPSSGHALASACLGGRQLFDPRIGGEATDFPQQRIGDSKQCIHVVVVQASASSNTRLASLASPMDIRA